MLYQITREATILKEYMELAVDCTSICVRGGSRGGDWGDCPLLNLRK